MSDIYQSPGDRLRFEVLLKSLTEGNLNIAVLSKHDQVLDYYGRLFEERLLSKGEQHVEFCTSTNSEHLVQKFNEILSQVSLDQALEKDAKHAPRRYLIFRDSVLMQDFELQLLARLVNGFPAGNISVILLINNAGNYKSKVAAFGKNLLEWEVETQAGEAKEPLTDWVREEPVLEPEPLIPADVPTLGEEVAPASKLLNMPTKTAWRIPGFGRKKEAEPMAPSLPDAAPLPQASPAAAPVAAIPAASMPSLDLPVAPAPIPPMPDVLREPILSSQQPIDPTIATPNFAKPQTKKSYAGWLLLLMLLSIGIFGVMYQDLIADEAEKLKKYVLRGTPAAPASHEVSSAANSVVDAASSAASVASESLAVASASDAVSPAASVVESKVASALVTDVASATKDAGSATKTEVAATDKAEPKPESKTEPKAKAKEADPKSDDQWVAQLSSNSYVLQLSAMDNEEEIRAFKRSNPVYAKARIMQAPKKGSNKRYFILVAGPFESKAEADAYMQTSPLLAKGWLRTAKSMKTQFGKS
jgi:septal ring-binding cell division protein DamX